MLSHAFNPIECSQRDRVWCLWPVQSTAKPPDGEEAKKDEPEATKSRDQPGTGPKVMAHVSSLVPPPWEEAPTGPLSLPTIQNYRSCCWLQLAQVVNNQRSAKAAAAAAATAATAAAAEKVKKLEGECQVLKHELQELGIKFQMLLSVDDQSERQYDLAEPLYALQRYYSKRQATIKQREENLKQLREDAPKLELEAEIAELEAAHEVLCTELRSSGLSNENGNKERLDRLKTVERDRIRRISELVKLR